MIKHDKASYIIESEIEGTKKVGTRFGDMKKIGKVELRDKTLKPGQVRRYIRKGRGKQNKKKSFKRQMKGEGLQIYQVITQKT